MAFVQRQLKSRGAKSIETVTFVDKGTRRALSIDHPKYVGFQYNEDPFIIGFGFDYSGFFRNLPAVYQMV